MVCEMSTTDLMCFWEEPMASHPAIGSSTRRWPLAMGARDSALGPRDGRGRDVRRTSQLSV